MHRWLTLFALLISLIAPAAVYSQTNTPAAMSSPTAGSTLGTSNVLFTWSTGIGATEYTLWLGLSGPGSSSLYASGWVTTASTTAASLPAKGVTIYARLYSHFSTAGGTQYIDYTYTEAAVSTPATMSSPTAGSILGTSNVQFTWAGGSGVTEYTLWLGVNGPGSSDFYVSGWVTGTSATVTSLPAKGATVYARLFSVVGGAIEFNDYTYIEASLISYEVDLSWDAPAIDNDPVVGYNVYRSPNSTSTYQLLNSPVDTQTTYVDSTVQDGQSYDYIIESVDAEGVESAPTSPSEVIIP
jgi:hypothetical protein